MIKVKNGQIFGGAAESLTKLIDKEIPILTSFRLAKTVRKVNESLEDIQKVYTKIVDKFAEKDKDGKNVVPKDDKGNIQEGQVTITDIPAFNKETSELMDHEIELDVDTILLKDLGKDIVLKPSILVNLDWLLKE